ncbi:MAG: DUF393 domain-containing protein [Sterolibacteriaceae bacterium]|nr:DUF393 domain-containing protein [Candidatus Methylophosphatis haderslevensis]
MNDIYPLTLLYDGDCAICRFEVASLERRDTLRRLRFVDIAAPGFDAGRWGRRNWGCRRLARFLSLFPSAAELDARIHAATAGHEILVGVDVSVLAVARRIARSIAPQSVSTPATARAQP